MLKITHIKLKTISMDDIRISYIRAKYLFLEKVITLDFFINSLDNHDYNVFLKVKIECTCK